MKVFANRSKLLLALMPAMAIAFYIITFNTSLKADNTYKPVEKVDNIIVMADKPASGTPGDFSVLDNIAIANKILFTADYFEGVSNGEVKAFGTTQKVYGKRKTKDGAVFSQSISVSSFVKLADQQYVAGGAYLIRDGSNIKGDSADFGAVRQMSSDGYLQKYGMPPRELCKYIIDETTVLETSVESAPVTDEGEYVFRLTLDPTASTLYYANEVRTRSGASADYPKFQNVTLTVVMDRNWLIRSYTVEETYAIDKPMNVTCKATLTETFTDINAGLDIPEAEPFLDFVPSGEPDEPPADPDNPVLFLGTAFAPYLSGDPLYLDARIKVPTYGVDMKLAADIDLAAMRFDILLDDSLYVSYRQDKTQTGTDEAGAPIYEDNSTVHIKAGGLSGRLTVRTFADILPDLVAALPDVSPKPADMLNGLNADDLSALLDNATLVKGDEISTVKLPLTLGDVRLNVEIKAYNAGGLHSIKAGVGLFNLGADIEVLPASDKPAMPETADIDLTPIADFLPPLVRTFGAESIGLNVSSADISYNDLTIGLTGAAAVNLGEAVSASADLTAVIGEARLPLSLAYLNDTIYLSAGNITVKATTDELTAAVGRFTENDGIQTESAAFTLSGLLEHIEGLTVEGNTLTVRLSVGAVSLSHDGRTITRLSVQTAELDGFILSADVDLTVGGAPTDIPVPENAIALSDALALYDAVCRTAQADGFIIEGAANVRYGDFADSLPDYTLTLDRNAAFTLNGTFAAMGIPLSVTRTAEYVYLSAAGFNVRFAPGETAAVPAFVTDLLPAELTGLLTAEDTAALVEQLVALLPYLTVSCDQNALTVDFTMPDGLSVTANVAYGDRLESAELTVTAGDLSLELTGTLTEGSVTVTPPDGDYTTVNGDDLPGTVLSVLDNKQLSADFTAEITAANKTINVTGDLTAAVYGQKPYVRVNAQAAGLTVAAVYADGTLYLTVDAIKLKLNTADIDGVLDALDGLLPADTLTVVRGIPALDFSALTGTTDGLSYGLTLGADELGVSLETADKTRVVLTCALPRGGAVSGLTADITADGFALTFGVHEPSLTDITERPIYPPADADEYADLAHIASFVQPVYRLATSERIAAELAADIAYGSFRDTLTGTAHFNTGSMTAAAELTLEKAGLTAGIVYTDDTVYASLGQIAVKAGVSDLLTLSESLVGPLDVNTDIAGLLSYVRGVSVRDGVLTLSLTFATVTIDSRLAVTVATGETTVDGKTMNISLKASLTACDQPAAVVAPENAIALADVRSLYDALDDIPAGDGFTLGGTADIQYGDLYDTLTFSLILNKDLTFALDFALSDMGLAGKVLKPDARNLYISLGDFRFKTTLPADADAPNTDTAASTAAPANITAQLPQFVRDILPAELLALMQGGDSNDMLKNAAGLLPYLTLSATADQAAVAFKTDKLDVSLTVTADKQASLSMATTVNKQTVKVALNATLTRYDGALTIPVPDAAGYADTADKAGAFLLTLLEGKTLSLGLNVQAAAKHNDTSVDIEADGNLSVSVKDGELTFALSINAFDTDIELRAAGGTYYIGVGSFRLKLDKADEAELIDALDKNLPPFIGDFVQALLDFDIAALIGDGKPTAGLSIDDSIGGLTVTDGKLSLAFDVNNDHLAVTLPLPKDGVLAGAELTLFNDDGTTLNMHVTDPTVTVCATLPDCTPTDPTAYVDVMEFIAYIEAIQATVTAERFELTVANDVVINAPAKQYRTADARTDTYDSSRGATVHGKAVYENGQALFDMVTRPVTVKQGGMIRIQPEGIIGQSGWFVNVYLDLTIETTEETVGVGGDVVSRAQTHSLTATLVNDNGQKALYVDYNGMKVKIGFTELLGMLAYARDILGIQNTLLDDIPPEYYDALDASIFDDMAGMDGMRETIESLLKQVESVYNVLFGYEKTDGAQYEGALAAVGSLVEAANLNELIGIVEAFTDALKDNGLYAESSDGDIIAAVTAVVKTLASAELRFDGNSMTVELPAGDGVQSVSLAHADGKLSALTVNRLSAGKLSLSGALSLATENVEQVTAPADGNETYDGKPAGERQYYSDFSSVRDLFKDLINTANLKAFHIGGANDAEMGTITMTIPKISIIGININDAITVPIKFAVKVQLIEETDETGAATWKPLVYARFETPKVKPLEIVPIANEAITSLYYCDGKFLFTRTTPQTSKSDTSYTLNSKTTVTAHKTKTEYVTATVDEVIKIDETTGELDILNLMNYVYFVLPLSSERLIIGQPSIQQVINDAIQKGITKDFAEPSQILNYFGYDGTNYNLGIDLQEITRIQELNDVNIRINTKQSADGNKYLDNLQADVTFIKGVTSLLPDGVRMNINGYLVRPGQSMSDILYYDYLAPADREDKNVSQSGINGYYTTTTINRYYLDGIKTADLQTALTDIFSRLAGPGTLEQPFSRPQVN